ncbi:IS21-like element ISMac3 family helper ATPase IstB [Vallitalea sediminicola]
MYAKLLNNLEVLKLEKMHSYIPTYLDTVAKEGVSVLDALLHLTDKEILYKNEMASKIQVSVAGFPFVKRADEYDYDFQPSVKKAQIMDLCTLRFLEKKENILFYGTPGVGKTHLATAIGVEAASKRQLTYFITCHDLIQNLRKAYHENRLETRLKHYSKYKVLIIDEIGYLPVDQLGANLFFQLITKRYEHNSTIITTNQPFSKWGEVFSDMTLANAILDRLLHHSHIIKIIGPSYRTKDVLDYVQESKSNTMYKPS